MGSAPQGLLKNKTFVPLLVTQTIGVLTDNMLKSAFIFLASYAGLQLFGFGPQQAVMVGVLFYVAPFAIFSGVAGSIADHMDKAKIIRRTRLAEIGFAGLASVGLIKGSGELLLASLVLYATQSAFFAPTKLSVLPQVLNKEDLVDANALMKTFTYVAILVGFMAGGALAGHGLVVPLATILFGASVLSFLATLRLPEIPPLVNSKARPSLNPVVASARSIGAVAEDPRLIRSAVGIAWFWTIGLVITTVFPSIAANQLSLTPGAPAVLLGAFVVGIGLGTFLVAQLLNGEISAKHVPFGALGMAVFLADLTFAVSAYTPTAQNVGIAQFLSTWAGIRIVIDMIAIAAFGGVFIVPLNAIFQVRAKEHKRTATMAGSDILNALTMIVVTTPLTLAVDRGIQMSGLFTALAVINFAVAFYLFRMMPQEALKAVVATILQTLFKAKVENLEAYGDPDQPAVVVANHTSYLDAVLMAALLPGRPTFAISTNISRRWWVKPAFWFFDLIPVDPTNSLSVRRMVQLVKEEGRRLIIFPEGRLTETGALMKIYDGPALIAEKAGAPLIPVRIDGAQFSKFSYLHGKFPLQWFPEITLTVLERREFALPEDLNVREKRDQAASELHKVMTQMVYDTSPVEATLFEALIDAKKTFGKAKVLEDIERNPLGYKRIITGAFALGEEMAKSTHEDENVGLLLPNSSASVVAFFACHAYKRTPAMLNFTAGRAGVEAALKAAEIKTVFTSHRFIELGNLEELVDAIKETAKVIYLEDLKEKIGLTAKLKALAKASAPSIGLRLSGGASAEPSDKAVILFTSGSEGLPKGVVLSHKNLQANRFQVSSVIDFTPQDKVLNALPMFHSFGLTAGTLLPLLSGVRTFLYPSPLHYRIVSEVAYDTNATIMFGTDTFLRGYARVAHGYDFYSLRYAFAGAERVRPETRKIWAEKFGVRILEGYGTTETSPVTSINTPIANKPGSVGRLLPGMSVRLDDVPGVDKGGRLFVSGPNIMMGYLKADQPGIIQPPEAGWHDTGDIVTIDKEGFITIEGRAKRFAKIGGEMVSLSAVEGVASELWPEMPVCAVTQPHPTKGEQIVLLCESDKLPNGRTADQSELQSFAKSKGVAEIFIPKTLVSVAQIPVLGSGKTDFGAANELCKELMREAA